MLKSGLAFILATLGNLAQPPEPALNLACYDFGDMDVSCSAALVHNTKIYVCCSTGTCITSWSKIVCDVNNVCCGGDSFACE